MLTVVVFRDEFRFCLASLTLFPLPGTRGPGGFLSRRLFIGVLAHLLRGFPGQLQSGLLVLLGTHEQITLFLFYRLITIIYFNFILTVSPLPVHENGISI